MQTQSRLEAFVGTWRFVAPWDDDDWQSEYVISIEGGAPVIAAHDFNDGERFEISDVSWDGATLRFRSLMPSTSRIGIHELALAPEGDLQSTFTFTFSGRLSRVAA